MRLQAESIEINSTIVTNGHSLTLVTRKLRLSPKAEIVAFKKAAPDNGTVLRDLQPASFAKAKKSKNVLQNAMYVVDYSDRAKKPGQQGVHGKAGRAGLTGVAGKKNPGAIFIFASEIHGLLRINGTGQKGGKGGRGQNGQKGGQGTMGHRAESFGGVVKKKGAGKGGRGGTGGAGGRGGQGGAGGDAVPVFVHYGKVLLRESFLRADEKEALLGSNAKNSNLFYKVKTSPGLGGAGGDPGRNGEGGAGGPGGDAKEFVIGKTGAGYTGEKGITRTTAVKVGLSGAASTNRATQVVDIQSSLAELNTMVAKLCQMYTVAYVARELYFLSSALERQNNLDWSAFDSTKVAQIIASHKQVIARSLREVGEFFTNEKDSFDLLGHAELMAIAELQGNLSDLLNNYEKSNEFSRAVGFVNINRSIIKTEAQMFLSLRKLGINLARVDKLLHEQSSKHSGVLENIHADLFTVFGNTDVAKLIASNQRESIFKRYADRFFQSQFEMTTKIMGEHTGGEIKKNVVSAQEDDLRTEGELTVTIMSALGTKNSKSTDVKLMSASSDQNTKSAKVTKSTLSSSVGNLEHAILGKSLIPKEDFGFAEEQVDIQGILDDVLLDLGE